MTRSPQRRRGEDAEVAEKKPKLNFLRGLCVFFLGASAMINSRSTTMSAPLKEVPLTDVKLTDEFWTPKLEINRTLTIPDNIKKCEETGRLANFLRAAGKEPG